VVVRAPGLFAVGEVMSKVVDFIPWCEAFLILPEGEPLRFEPHQKDIFEHIFKFDDAGRLPYSLIIYSCPKKSGKTTMEAAAMAWVAFNWPNDEVLCCANSRDQVISRAVREFRGFIERNPMLRRECSRYTEKEIRLRNGTTISALTNDASIQAGANNSLSVWDELWGYVSLRDQKLWDELTPPPTRPNAFRFVGTYAGFEGESNLLEEIYWRVFERDGTVKPGVTRPLGDDFPCYAVGELFMYWDHEARMPWQTTEYYESQRNQLRPSAYLRLHENRWVSSEQSLFDMDRWDLCCDMGHKKPLPSKDVRLFVGVDASVKRDRSAVVSVFRDGPKICLGPKKYWQPTAEHPMDLEETMEAFILELARDFTIELVYYDPFQFHRSATTLGKAGIPLQEYAQSTGNLTEMGSNLYDLVDQLNIAMYPCAVLRQEAKVTIGKETARGFRIAKEKQSQKIDQVVALAMAAIACAKRINSGVLGGLTSEHVVCHA
jgi:phage terminase large subunit-like protein